MRAVRFHEHGDLDVLTVEELPRPEPGPGRILVAVEAIGVNPIDTQIREGTIIPNNRPMIPGSDLAGVVESVGLGVDEFSTGDRIFGTGLDMSPCGTYAEYAVVPTDNCCTLPETVSFETGAAVAHVGVTAWRALFDHASLTPGDICLIHGGSGGVGHVAVQLAATSGAEVLATVGSSHAKERVRQLGAQHVFDYQSDSLADDVLTTAPEGVDVVVDHMIDQYLQVDVDVAAFGANVIALGGQTAELNNAQSARNKDVVVYHVSMFNTPSIQNVLEHLRRLLERERLTAVVARTYPLSEADEAQRAVVEDSFVGKLVIRP